MADVRVTVDGGEAEDRIRRLALFLTDLRPFWPKVVPLFIGWTRRQFESEGAYWTRRWAPLSPAYAARKRLLWGERPILQASGQARRAASNPRRVATPTSLTLIIDDAGPQHGPVLQWHQQGTHRMPARPVIGETLPSGARAELDEAAAAYVRDLLGRF